MAELANYKILADLFGYPDQGFPARVKAVRDYLEPGYPEAVQVLEKFLAYLPVEDVIAMQELFTRSFDIQAATTLDIGYVLFGDDYKRGEMLANLSREHRLLEHDCGSELADHLPNILQILNCLEGELQQELVSEVLMPALQMMVSEFSSERMEKKNYNYKKHYKTVIEMPSIKGAADLEASTLYKYALTSLAMVLKQDFQVEEKTGLKITSDFLKSVSSENEIEEKSTQSY